MFATPILFIIFNRPELTQRIFQEIKNQKPKYLFIAADGPRPQYIEDVEKCRKSREIVLNGIDWNCEVKTMFRDDNLGCGRGVSEAISWFFENVEQGIILEDDCLPNQSFFRFCEELLEKYKSEEKVYAISGDNFQDGIQRGVASYFFSSYTHIWGWASWRRAWEHYDYHMHQLEEFKRKKLINKIDKRNTFEKYWISIFKKTALKEIDTWDYQWQFSVWNNEGLIVSPNVNLISNIGFGLEATNTTTLASPFANLQTESINTISHPKVMKVDKKADRYTSDKVFKIAKINKITFYGLKKFLKIKLGKFFAPEIVQLIRRKTKNKKNEGDQNSLKIPRYRKTFVQLEGRQIQIPDIASFQFMFKEIFEQEIYKFKTSSPEPYIIDGGANIGLATIYLKKLFPFSKIISFEPDPGIFQLLKYNIEVFNYRDVELIQKGIWDKNKKLFFIQEGADAGLIAEFDKNNFSAESEIEVVSLRPYLQRTVDFLKLDIEGAETIVLKDIEDDLIRVERIFVEYHSFIGHPQSLNEIINILTEANFRLYMSIPGNNSLNSPLMGLGNYNNMDFQLNIFGFKEL